MMQSSNITSNPMNSYTTIRCILYALILFLTPFAEKIGPVLQENLWPTPQSLVLCSLTGLVAALVGVRAYIDSSFARSRNQTNNK